MLHILFYRHFCNIVKPDIINLLNSLHEESLHLDRLNYAHVVLMLKKIEARKVEDFRPISIRMPRSRSSPRFRPFNFLREMLGELIEDHQLGFLKSRNSLDSIATTQAIQFSEMNKRLGLCWNCSFKRHMTCLNGSVYLSRYWHRISAQLGYPWLSFGLHQRRYTRSSTVSKVGISLVKGDLDRNTLSPPDIRHCGQQTPLYDCEVPRFRPY